MGQVGDLIRHLSFLFMLAGNVKSLQEFLPGVWSFSSYLCQYCREQEKLKEKLILEDQDEWAKHRVVASGECQSSQGDVLEYVAGVDLSFVKGDEVNACAALVVIRLPHLEVVRLILFYTNFTKMCMCWRVKHNDCIFLIYILLFFFT